MPIRAGSRSCASTSRRKKARPRRRNANSLNEAARLALPSPLRGPPERGGMTACATWVASLKGWRRALFAVALGALSLLAFAPLHLWSRSVPHLRASHLAARRLSPRPSRARRAAQMRRADRVLVRLRLFPRRNFYWVAEAFLVEPWRHGWLIPFVMTALPAGMALFFVAAATLAMLMWWPGMARAFALAIAFGLAEYARGHVLTGLPWNLVGYALLDSGGMMQLASLFGVYALSLLAVLLFASPASIITPSGSRSRWPQHGLPRWPPAHRAWRRRLVGRATTRSRRQRRHWSPGAHRPGRHRSGREMATREQRRDLHRLSQPDQVGVHWAQRHFPRRVAGDGGAVPSRQFSRSASRSSARRCPRGPRCSSAQRVSSRSVTRKAR